MDATVNTGLGAGTREREMMMIQMIQQLQEKLLMTLGPENPYVSPDNLYNGIAKSVEAAGLKSPDLYFSKPTPEEIQRRMQASAGQPNAESRSCRCGHRTTPRRRGCLPKTTGAGWRSSAS